MTINIHLSSTTTTDLLTELLKSSVRYQSWEKVANQLIRDDSQLSAEVFLQNQAGTLTSRIATDGSAVTPFADRITRVKVSHDEGTVALTWDNAHTVDADPQIKAKLQIEESFFPDADSNNIDLLLRSFSNSQSDNHRLIHEQGFIKLSQEFYHENDLSKHWNTLSQRYGNQQIQNSAVLIPIFNVNGMVVELIILDTFGTLRPISKPGDEVHLQYYAKALQSKYQQIVQRQLVTLDRRQIFILGIWNILQRWRPVRILINNILRLKALAIFRGLISLPRVHTETKRQIRAPGNTQITARIESTPHTREEERIPVIIIDPGYTATKETFCSLADTIIHNYARLGKKVRVLRFDHRNHRGESSNESPSQELGHEYRNYRLSVCSEDITIVCDYARDELHASEVIVIANSISSTVAVNAFAKRVTDDDHAEKIFDKMVSLHGATDIRDLLIRSTGTDYIGEQAVNAEASARRQLPNLVLGNDIDVHAFVADAWDHRLASWSQSQADYNQVDVPIIFMVGGDNLDRWVDHGRIKVLVDQKTANRSTVLTGASHRLEKGETHIESVFPLVALTVYQAMFPGERKTREAFQAVEADITLAKQIRELREIPRRVRRTAESIRKFWNEYLQVFDVFYASPSFQAQYAEYAQLIQLPSDAVYLGFGVGTGQGEEAILGAKKDLPKQMILVDLDASALGIARAKIAKADPSEKISVTTCAKNCELSRLSPLIDYYDGKTKSIWDIQPVPDGLTQEVLNKLRKITLPAECQLDEYLKGKISSEAERARFESIVTNSLLRSPDRDQVLRVIQDINLAARWYSCSRTGNWNLLSRKDLRSPETTNGSVNQTSCTDFIKNIGLTNSTNRNIRCFDMSIIEFALNGSIRIDSFVDILTEQGKQEAVHVLCDQDIGAMSALDKLKTANRTAIMNRIEPADISLAERQRLATRLRSDDLGFQQLDLHNTNLNMQLSLPAGSSAGSFLQPGSVDCILEGLFLPYVYNPRALVREQLKLLRKPEEGRTGGVLVASTMIRGSDFSVIYNEFRDNIVGTASDEIKTIFSSLLPLVIRYMKPGESIDQLSGDDIRQRLLQIGLELFGRAAKLNDIEEEGFFQFFSREEFKLLFEKAVEDLRKEPGYADFQIVIECQIDTINPFNDVPKGNVIKLVRVAL